VGIQIDVTHVKELEDELRHEAAHDKLTGVLDRGELMNRLSEEFERAQRYGRSGCIVIFDLDYFKEVNDTHGHLIGDQVLSRVGQELIWQKRATDLYGRSGGEEFCLYFPETDLTQGQKTAQRLLEALRTLQFSSHKGSFTVTASIGVSALHPQDRSVGEPLSRADRALYRAKENGRNQVVRASDGAAGS
jgi:diguanylate cyclase (GGDEF)-like protein